MNRTSMLDEMLDELSHDVPCAVGDLNKKEPGMTQQRHESDAECKDFPVDGEMIESSIVDELPPGH
jgi:hypothetical protein